MALFASVTLLWLLGGSLVLGHPMEEEDGDYKTTYEGYKVLRTSPLNRKELVDALMMFDGLYGIHFWTFPKMNHTTDIMISPKAFKDVRNYLTELELQHEILIEDVNQLLRNENPPMPESSLTRQYQHRMTWDNYHRYDTIKEYCRAMATSRNGIVSSEIIGTSTEGREIIMVKVSKGGARNKPAIFIDGGMHAREWISPATTTYIMNKLIGESDRSSSDLLDSFDWYFVPVINVDGYEYTHTRQRMWRKTRSRTSGSWLRCYGVDPNRNWDFHWGETGSSTNPCSDIYAGPRAFSEPETTAVAKAILARKENIVMYLTFHSYSQLWLVPYGYGDEKPADYKELLRLGNVGKDALENTFGTKYKIGTAPDLLYKAAGGSDDWAKGAAGIKYSYTLELRDEGEHGFMLPANQIKATGEETYNGVAAVARDLATKMQRPN